MTSIDLNDKATNVVNTDNSGGNTPTYTTKRASFALNKKKQIKNLKKDAIIATFDTVVNNYNQNINIKCSSGFFLEVASPCLHDLAKQSIGISNSISISDLLIHCSDAGVSLDKLDLLLNRIYFFNLSDISDPDIIIATVTVHVHVSSKLVQLQGSKLIKGLKAPVWFYDHVLKGTLERESERMKVKIDNTKKNSWHVLTN